MNPFPFVAIAAAATAFSKPTGRRVATSDTARALQEQHEILVTALNKANNAIAKMSQMAHADPVLKEKVGPMLDPMIKGIRQTGQHTNMLGHFARHWNRYENSSTATFDKPPKQETLQDLADHWGHSISAMRKKARADAARLNAKGREDYLRRRQETKPGGFFSDGSSGQYDAWSRSLAAFL
jgi:hypothetical protein